MVKGPGAADKPLFVADTRLAESELDPRVDLTPLSKSLLDEPWLPTAARAVTTVGAAFPAVPPPLSPRPLPLDPWFPQFSGQTPAAATIRSRLSFYLSPLTDNGRFVAQPTSPALWAALDRLAPQLALTTEEGASALIAQEVKTLIPDRAELAATLEQMGFNGNPPHPSPTAEAFARRVAYDLGGTLRQARSSVLPKVLEGVSNTTVRSLVPISLSAV